MHAKKNVLGLAATVLPAAGADLAVVGDAVATLSDGD